MKRYKCLSDSTNRLIEKFYSYVIPQRINEVEFFGTILFVNKKIDESKSNWSFTVKFHLCFNIFDNKGFLAYVARNKKDYESAIKLLSVFNANSLYLSGLHDDSADKPVTPGDFRKAKIKALLNQAAEYIPERALEDAQAYCQQLDEAEKKILAGGFPKAF